MVSLVASGMDCGMKPDTGAKRRASGPLGTLGRQGLMAVGVVAFALGAVGIVVPLLPTTIFWIIAAACFAKSAPRWQRWIYQHSRFGGVIRDFMVRGVIRREAKLAALAGMAASFILTAAVSGLNLLWLGIVAAMLFAVGTYVATRPEAAGAPASPTGIAPRTNSSPLS